VAADRPGSHDAHFCLGRSCPAGPTREGTSLASEETTRDPSASRGCPGTPVGRHHAQTPGADFELAVGFYVQRGDLAGPGNNCARGQATASTGTVDEQPALQHRPMSRWSGWQPWTWPLERHFSVHQRLRSLRKAERWRVCASAVTGRPRTAPCFPADMLRSLPAKLRGAQRLVRDDRRTGHARPGCSPPRATWFRPARRRRDATTRVEKLIGWAFMENKLPLAGHLLMVSGRSSFRAVQKSLAAGAPALCSRYRPPSSLAVEVAREYSGLPSWVPYARRGSRSTAGEERAGLA